MFRPVVRVSLLICVSLLLATAPAGARVRPEQKLRNARLAYQDLLQAPDRGLPERLLEDAECIAVIPNVIKGAFGLGGRHGRGVLSCRGQERGWSPPIFVSLSGGSFGFQIGGQATDVVLFFMTDRSVRSLLKSKFTVSADAGAAAGPVGRSAVAGTDLRMRAEILSYAKARGLFAGVAIDGARLAPHYKSTWRLYGERVWPDEVLFEHKVPLLPEDARAFVELLP